MLFCDAGRLNANKRINVWNSPYDVTVSVETLVLESILIKTLLTKLELCPSLSSIIENDSFMP